ncbi:ATP-dependent transcriptional regulator [Leisingera sp. ANG-M1]|nr:ATP-dependent transcriptional regulator [Leisingera sp. ANG-M1]
MRGAAAGLSMLALAACSMPPPRAEAPTRAVAAPASLPPVKVFTARKPSPPQRSNADIARDFLDLHFALEGGSTLPQFTRFEEPITLRVTGDPAPNFTRDLNGLLARLQGEAGIDIRQVSGGAANITIESVSRAEIRRALPKAACFVVPNVSSLAEFRRNRRAPRTNWSLLRNRQQLAVFIPNDVSPQEVRDCLHEELAQAIGPLNDLYRLPDSIFNDDNIHAVLTGFDMLILRAGYAPELRTGMSRSEVAARLPAILARLNPAGERIPAQWLAETPRAWVTALEQALGPQSSLKERLRAANRAAEIARDLGWQDHRRALSHYTLGRMLHVREPELAQKHFRTAENYLAGLPATSMHMAKLAVQLSAYDIAHGRGAAALARLLPAAQSAAAHENAALLSTLLMLQAEALELEHRNAEARRVRLDSLGWARYGFGPDWIVEARLEEIAALRPSAP